MAAEPQVNIKISVIGLAGVPWTVSNNRVIVEQVMDSFGPDRVMFASNFPVDGLTDSFADIYGGYLEITKGWSEYEQSAAFIGNAVRHYSLNLTNATDSDQAVKVAKSEAKVCLDVRIARNSVLLTVAHDVLRSHPDSARVGEIGVR